MDKIKPFITLNSDEREMTKNEIATYLETYYRFSIQIQKHPNDSFFENFKKVQNKNTTNNYVREFSYYTEYDYMIQIATIYTINKLFSYYIDSNLYKLNDNSIEEKYFLKGSTKYNKKDTINYIRNAFNHNDKEHFQLFRLIQKQNNPKIYIEIFLRQPNFHIIITIEELLDLLKPVLTASSLYTYLYLDENNNYIQTITDFHDNINKTIQYEITQIYDLDKKLDPTKQDIITDDDVKGNNFSKKIKFTKEQIETIKNTYEVLKTNNEILNEIIFSRILRDTIPFGMSKIEGYLFDLNYFLSGIYNYEDTYTNWKDTICDQLNFQTKSTAITSFEKIYYLINEKSNKNRALLLFISYILDSIIPDKKSIQITEKEIPKDNLRNSLVHGTYFNNSEDILFLYDYKHKNKKGKTDNRLILEDSVINKFSIIDLYNSLLKHIDIENYTLPLDFIVNLDKFNGLKITFKEGDTRYLINTSFDYRVTPFLGLKDKNGNLMYMDDFDFDLLESKISKINFSSLDLNDEEIISFIKKIPSTCRQATKKYITLSENKNILKEEYFEYLKDNIKELENICMKHIKISKKNYKKIKY